MIDIVKSKSLKLFFTLALVSFFLYFPKECFSNPFNPHKRINNALAELLYHNGIPTEELKSINFNTEYKILMWNINKSSRFGFYKDFVNLIQDKDIVLLQESLMTEKFVDTLLNSPHQWTTAVTFCTSNKSRSFNNAGCSPTGVSFGTNLINTDQKGLLSPVKEPIFKTPKASLFFKVPIKGVKKSLLVANVHAINFVKISSFKFHMNQFFSEVRKHDGPVLIGGDFNTWNKERRKFIYKMINSLNLRSSDINPKSGKLGGDFDYFFYRDLFLTEQKILKKIKSSDHLPLYIKIKIKINDLN